MGGKNSTSTSSVSIPPEVLARYNAVNARAENVAQTPFQPYSGQFVAGLTPTQQAALTNTNDAQGMAQPYIGAGSALTLASAQDLQPADYNAESVGKYFNPFVNSVYATTAANIANTNQQQMQQEIGNEISKGAYGGDRAGIARAELARQQNLAGNQTLAQIAQQGFAGAQQEFNQQQQLGLGAAQNTAARMAAAGQQIGALGMQGQQAALQGAQAQMQAGQIEQGTQQADLTAQYNQFLQEKSYPFQVAQFLANIAMGTGALSGSTTTTTSPAPFFSDERMKDNVIPIGKTFDGQPIYRFNYKGDPRTQIGLVAQDVMHSHPEAVGMDNGFLTVDYADATNDAAVAGLAHAMHGAHADHYAGGGLVPYQSMQDGQSPFPRPMSYVPPANLPVAGLAVAKTPENKQDNTLGDGIKTASGLMGLYKDAKGLGWVGGKAEGGARGYASGGLAEALQGRDISEFMYREPSNMAELMRQMQDTPDLARARPYTPPPEGYNIDQMRMLLGRADGGEVDDDYPDAPMAGKAPDVHTYVPKADLPVASLKTANTPDNKQKSPFGDILDAGKLALGFAALADGGAAEDPYDAYFQEAEKATGVPARFLRAQAQTETGLNPNLVGKSGEVGIMQVMPSTARNPGYGLAGVDPATLSGPEGARNNILFAAKYLKARGDAAGVRDYNDPGQWSKALASYNGGGDPNYVQKTFRNAGLGVPATGGDLMAYTDAPRPLSVSKGFPIQPRGAQAPGLAAGAPPSSGGFLSRVADKIGNDDNAKLSLLAGLFGMLSSKSHWLVPAIGEGGLAAINTYKDLAKQDADIESTRASAASTRMDALGKSVQYINGKAYIWTPQGLVLLQNYEDRPTPVAGSRNSNDIVRANGPSASPGSVIPKDAPIERKELPPPPVVEAPAAGQAARANAVTVPGQNPAQPPAQNPMKPPPPPPNQQPPQEGSTVASRLSRETLSAADKEGTAFASADPAKHPAYAESLKRAEAMTNEAQAVREEAERVGPVVNELAKTIANTPKSGWMQSGAWADARAKIGRELNQVLTQMGLAPFADPANISNKDIQEKLQQIQAGNNANVASGTGHTAAYLIDQYKATVPNANMTPEAQAEIMAQNYIQQQRAIDRHEALSEYRKRSGARNGSIPGTANDFEARFATDYDRTNYALDQKAIKEGFLKERLVNGKPTNAMQLILNGQITDPKQIDKLLGRPGIHRYFTGSSSKLRGQ